MNLTAKSNSLFKCIITYVSLRFPACKVDGKCVTLCCPKHKITELFQTLVLCNTRPAQNIFFLKQRNSDFETLYLVSKNCWKAEGLSAGFSFFAVIAISPRISLDFVISAGGAWWEYQAYLQICLVPTSITQYICSCISHSLL